MNRPSTWGHSLRKPAKMAFGDSTSLSPDFSASLEMNHDIIIKRKILLFQVHIIMLSNLRTKITWNLWKYLVLQLICNFTLTKFHGIPLQPFSVSSFLLLYPEFSGIVHFFPSANQEFHIWISARGSDTNEHPLLIMWSIMVSDEKVFKIRGEACGRCFGLRRYVPYTQLCFQTQLWYTVLWAQTHQFW